MNFGDLGRVLTDSLPKFIRGYIFLSAVVTGVVVALLLPAWKRTSVYPTLLRENRSTFALVSLFVLTVVVLSMVSAFVALPVYRLLEGYFLPSWLRRRLTARRRREWQRLSSLVMSVELVTNTTALAVERLRQYPSNEMQLLPTRLGNAMRSMEVYGTTRYGLDSQMFWHELLAAAPERLVTDVDEAREIVDFYVNTIVQLVFLAGACVTTAIVTDTVAAPVTVAIIAVLFIPLALSSAVRNIDEWRYSLQAVINTGRVGLAKSMGLRLPATFAQEREMWTVLARAMFYGADDELMRYLDVWRAPDDGGMEEQLISG